SFTGTAQFRIKMQGLDKSVHYSDIRSVQASQNSTLFSVYPNPSSSGNVTVFFTGTAPYQLSLFDMSGRLVRSSDGITTTSQDLKKLTPGIYLLSITDGRSKTESQKLVIK
ncbi:MAG TPA: T9SS type A sorting domain-containing protein, partial [Flavisolibacter sp.]